MRIRSIKPEFFLDPKILDLPPLARLLFIGLWCASDREGRVRYEPRILRLKILPEEAPKTIEAMFAALEMSGLTVRYVVDGKEYLAIPHFSRHQRPNNRELASTLPEPDPIHSVSSLCLDTAMTVSRLSAPLSGLSGRGKGREGEGEQEGSTTSAPRFADDANAPLLTFPTNGPVKTWDLTEEQVVIWSALFPELDVVSEARKALAWVEANRKKTANGMKRYLVGWLTRANDRGRSSGGPRLSAYEQQQAKYDSEG